MLRAWRIAVLAMFLAIGGASCQAGQFGAPQPMSAMEIPQSALMTAQDLNQALQAHSPETGLILQVGSRLMFDQGHIPGAEYAGPASQAAGLEMLKQKVSSLSRNKTIILYCGCCPWVRCPNMGAAFHLLRDMGFTQVKALYLPNNFGTDWVAKGYRVEKAQ